ncbi:MAG TPA: rhodanese-like domain-containing protein [Fredinandcohnia sp.]|nr:rhodanese-like domain-containing protein [Fredinandcohnia sp.]
MPRFVSPQEAHDLMEREGYVYVDVRSPEEYGASHPRGAINIPFLFFTPEGRKPNPEFVAAFRKAMPPGSKFIVGCAGGNRSAMAIEVLEREGWSEILECKAGFAGRKDEQGRVVETGWSAAGLPCESGQPAGRSWDDLR